MLGDFFQALMFAELAKIIPFAEIAKKNIHEATEQLKASKPELFVEKPILAKARNWISARYKNYAQPLKVTGVEDPKLANRIAQAVLHYMNNIEGGKEVLKDAYSNLQKPEITLHFGQPAGFAEGAWDPAQAKILINFKVEFEELIRLLLNPPKSHVVSVDHTMDSPANAISTLFWEFHNAANRWVLNTHLITYRLMFKSASDFALACEYSEFLGLSRGAETFNRKYSDGSTQIVDFNEYYKRAATTIDFNLFTNGTHASIYEKYYNDLFQRYQEVTRIIGRFVDGYRINPNAEKDFLLACKPIIDSPELNPKYKDATALDLAEHIIQDIQKVTCREVNNQLQLDKLAKLLEEARKPVPEHVGRPLELAVAAVVPMAPATPVICAPVVDSAPSAPAIATPVVCAPAVDSAPSAAAAAIPVVCATVVVSAPRAPVAALVPVPSLLLAHVEAELAAALAAAQAEIDSSIVAAAEPEVLEFRRKRKFATERVDTQGDVVMAADSALEEDVGHPTADKKARV